MACDNCGQPSCLAWQPHTDEDIHLLPAQRRACDTAAIPYWKERVSTLTQAFEASYATLTEERADRKKWQSEAQDLQRKLAQATEALANIDNECTFALAAAAAAADETFELACRIVALIPKKLVHGL